jgi:hypothetical protein
MVESMMQNQQQAPAARQYWQINIAKRILRPSRPVSNSVDTIFRSLNLILSQLCCLLFQHSILIQPYYRAYGSFYQPPAFWPVKRKEENFKLSFAL